MQEHSDLPHHVEHIVPRQHGGSDDRGNLALACQRCNLNKGPNLTGIDPVSGEIYPLFDPRREQWSDHFLLQDFRINGRTPTGRATASLLGMNEERRLKLRRELADSPDHDAH